MRPSRAALLALMIAVTSGCALRPEVTASRPLWPFEQVEIQTSLGLVVGYVSRPEGSPERIVVALQSSPCSSDAEGRPPDMIGTSGIVWQQLKHDSIFLQFERPGGSGAGPQSLIVECERLDRDHRGDYWRRAISDSVAALREYAQADDAPTVYIGFGAGATPAIAAATSDRDASTVALVSGVFDADFAAALQALPRRSSRSRPTVLLLHAANDSRTPLSQAQVVFDQLRSAHVPVALEVFERANHDFGLTASDADCFDILAQSLAESIRRAGSPLSEGATNTRCESARDDLDAPRPIEIEGIQRL